jgi:hypothetical protein
MARITLNAIELRKVLKDRYGEDNVFFIHYTEPNDIYENRIDFDRIKHKFVSAVDLEIEHPKITLSFNL